MTMKVFYPSKIASTYPRGADLQIWQTFEALLDPEVEFITGDQTTQPTDYHVLVSGRPDQELLTASPNLHTLVIPWAGLPDVTAELMADFPHIAIYNLHHNARTTAESAMMLMLTAAKRIIPIDQTFRKNDWRPRYAPNEGVYLHGKTVLVLGFGSIGKYVARACQALGMRVIGIKRNPDPPLSDDIDAQIYPPQALHELLPRANVLIITLPLTKETNGLIGEKELTLLPENSVLVNVGRALIVDQEALYRALKDGKLHSAGIDVWYHYPPDEDSRVNTPPADFPFHELDNIVMSPHRGGGSMEVEGIRMQHLAELLNQLAREGKAPNKINLEQGY
jgi:phosphoglycerate dehydrogenase-like enzyme